jgi:F-type H+-transporting ATPase subunit gamma
LGDVPPQEDVRALARAVSDAYLSQEMDRVFLVYPQFASAMVQRPTAVRLLPIQPPEDVDLHLAPQYIFEPDATTILAALLPRYLETQLRQALLETVACFYGAQMIAMRTATDNATELLEDLALGYSKARQTAITTQILEIVAGAGDGRANITR